MGSKGRIPPPHLRRPLPGPGMLHADPYGPGMHPPPGAFPYDMLPPPEILEQKLAAQHVEMERLATENHRLAATHSTLRQELAAAQQELQRMQTHMGFVKSEQEQEMRILLDKIANMEAELKSSESLKLELQQAHVEAQNLVAARQELMLKAQQLTQDLQRSQSDVQQAPALMSELEAIRQEYQHCRATYDYERKIFSDHYESLQLMEKNYVSMVREVEKLRVELSNATTLERRSGAAYGSNTGYKENDTSGHQAVGQSSYEDVYGVSHGRGSSTSIAALQGGSQPVAVPARAGYEAPKGPSYDTPRNANYDASRAAGGYEASRGPSYDATVGASYDAPRGSSYEAQRVGSGYDASRGASGAQAAAAPGNTAAPYGLTQAQNPYMQAQVPSPYGTSQLPTRTGGVGGSVVRR